MDAASLVLGIAVGAKISAFAVELFAAGMLIYRVSQAGTCSSVLAAILFCVGNVSAIETSLAHRFVVVVT